jgi:hypothetical protein
MVRPVDWDGIFERRPDLRPPGYEEAVSQVREVQPRRRGRSKGKRAHYTGLKHMNPDP